MPTEPFVSAIAKRVCNFAYSMHTVLNFQRLITKQKNSALHLTTLCSFYVDAVVGPRK